MAREFRARFGVRWLPPLGFQNTYAIAVRRETAGALRLRTLSDLARVAAGASRPASPPTSSAARDGLPGLGRAYGLRFREVRALLPAVKYQALAAGEVDVIDGYATDGLIARYDLVVLSDDRGFFPPYEAAALRRAGGSPREAPSAVARADRAERRGSSEADDARAQPAGRGGRRAGRAGRGRTRWRASASTPRRDGCTRGRRAAASTAGSRSAPTSGASAARCSRSRCGTCSWSSLSLAARSLLAVPLGLALERARGARRDDHPGGGLLQTMPGIALLAFMIPLLGIGVVPALVALFLYSLYPILRNTYTGVRDAAPTRSARRSRSG